MMNRPAALSCTTFALLLLALPALPQSPPEAEMRFSTGVMHLREGRIDLALEEFKKAVKEDGKNPYFQKGLGLAYSAKRDWKPAIAAFRRALELNPYYVDVRNDLAAALLSSGDREAGKKELLTAFSDPTNPTAEVSARNLGQAYYEEKNYAESLNWYRTSVGRNKDYADGYLGLSDTLAAMGQNEEAVVQLQAAVVEVPNDTSLQLALGQALLRAGRYGEARSRLEDVVRKDPAGALGRQAAEQLKSVLLSAMRSHEITVVDLPRTLGAAAWEALRRAELAVLLMRDDVRGVAAGREVVRGLEGGCDRLGLVVRQGRSRLLEPNLVATGVGLPLLGSFVEDQAFALAAERGDPPARSARSALARLCRHLLGDLLPTHLTEETALART
jgi:tetratricopeptide (TPR) repeat protein